MTLSAVFRWKHPDSTVSMNQRLQTLVPRGIFDGGDVTGGGGLTVNVAPFGAIGYDGMLVLDDAVQLLKVVAGQTNYVVVRAKYVTGSTPTVQWEVMTQAVYNLDPDRNYLIVFAVVTLAGGAVAVAPANISFLARDAVDPMQRHPFRGIVATPLLLPAHPPEQNRDGDMYFVLAAGGGMAGQTIYFWNAAGAAWDTLATGSYNVETTSMGDVLIQGERNRIEQGSGVLGGIRPGEGFASETEVGIIETPAIADQVGFDTFSCIVNGHYCQPYARYIPMPVKPAGADRYDLVYLEVWREAILVPETWAFPRNHDGTLTYTISLVSELLEAQHWTAGTGGDNIDLNELQSDDHNWIVTRYQFGTIQNVTSQSLRDNEVAAPLALNIDGNGFVAVPGADNRLWMAAAAVSSVDGESWAIPLFVVRRTSAEDHTTPTGAIQEFRNDIRFIFPVYAIADQAADRLGLDTERRTEEAAYQLTSPQYEKASGFLDSLDYAIDAGGVVNSINFYEDTARIRIRGLEDHFTFHGSPNVVLAAPPAIGYERALVYIKMSLTLFADATTRDNTMVSTRHRPYFPSSIVPLADLRAQGFRRGYCTYEVVVHPLGAAAVELDEHDAMVVAGWSKGDDSLIAINKEHQDGGIWSQVVLLDVDDRIHPWGHEWAIPVALIHRRNSAAWHYHSNPNGTGVTRPDSRTDATVIHPDDLVDLRRMVDVDPARLKDMLEQDIDRMMKGQLHTRMAEKWAGNKAGAEIAGSRILQSDFASVAGGTGWALPAPNGTRKIWSDAREFIPVCESFDMDPSLGVYVGTYVECNRGTGAITIIAPANAHLCRHLPAIYLTDGAAGNATYLEYESDPLWSTRKLLDDTTKVGATPWPSHVAAKAIIAASDTEVVLQYTNDGWIISVSDAYEHATEMQNTINYPVGGYVAGDICVVAFWVHYDRTLASSTPTFYNINHGLAEIPDEVHSVVKGPLGGTPQDANVGALYAVVRKTVTAPEFTTIITAADVAAASGLSGTHTIVGIDWQDANIKYSAVPAAVITEFLLNNAQSQIDVTWDVPFTSEVEFTVFFYTTTVDSWVEIGKGGKSVRGYYSWENTKTFTWPASPPASAMAFDIGTSIWHDVEVADRFVPMPQIWTNNTALGDDWVLWRGPEDEDPSFRVGYQFSNLISITNPGGATPPMVNQYFKFVYPKWDAPPGAGTDELLVHYTYTPYQGLSSTGGAIATPAAALTALKPMLHGTVEENTDHYVSQSGACSVFGGVDGWTGWPARRPNVTLNFLTNRFGQYNQTQLVKSTAASGLTDLGYGADPNSLAPAAILRLPFPQNILMVTGAYHKGTSDFDIDPGREGVNAGYFSYAPAYPGMLTTYAKKTGVAPGILYSQFVNGITRLAIPGEPKQQSQSRLIPACAYQPDTAGTNNESTYLTTSGTWVFVASKSAKLDIPIDVLNGHVVARTLTALDGFTIVGGTDLLDNIGLIVTTPLADYLKVGALGNAEGNYSSQTLPGELIALTVALSETLPGGLETTITTAPVFLGTAPGTILAYYAYAQQSTSVIGRILWTSGIVTFDRHIMHTLVTIESERQSYLGNLRVQDQTASEPIGAGVSYSSYTDLIRIPMGSHSLPTTANRNSYGSSAASLRGRTIEYPVSWPVGTIAAVEAHVQASELFHITYGRGIYLGSTTTRLNMPVLVPGSGTVLRDVITDAALPATTAQPPKAFPVAPTSSPFATSERRWALWDHGGPLAYTFYGLMINPADDDYRGQAVIQITGGPTMGTGSDTGAAYTADGSDGTALDAFWPSGRPIIKNQ